LGHRAPAIDDVGGGGKIKEGDINSSPLKDLREWRGGGDKRDFLRIRQKRTGPSLVCFTRYGPLKKGKEGKGGWGGSDSQTKKKTFQGYPRLSKKGIAKGLGSRHPRKNERRKRKKKKKEKGLGQKKRGKEKKRTKKKKHYAPQKRNAGCILAPNRSAVQTTEERWHTESSHWRR